MQAVTIRHKKLIRSKVMWGYRDFPVLCCFWVILLLPLGALQVIHTPFVFILTQLVQLESREYGLCQSMLDSWLN
jgi:hypothetical protein